MSTEPKRPIIEVKDLAKKYGDFTAVDGISFEVQPGETFGILGPNGAGKTTTLEMIEGIKRITGGSILVDGKDVSKQTHDVKSVIGVQLQASSFFEGLNLKELLVTFASLYGRTVDPMALLEQVQLTEKATSEVKDLSGGQKQRFSIAVGLVNDPKVLFLDEPTTGLDPQARRNLWDLVTKIKSQGKTIVLTTHYMDEAEVLCDRIAIMDNAKIIALDTTHNLIHSTGVHPTIEFKSNSSIPTEVLQNIPGVEKVLKNNGIIVLATRNPQETLDQLFAASRTHNFHIDQLVMKRATLEDVFLKLTGHQLRE
ncbi:MAG: ABC transporter ATP-binding protein [Candidatus Yanofskybacteria bacterium]|nr:ABC transporter ATP-binding protein [Candidatus Yanofskybacteria bacterium]